MALIAAAQEIRLLKSRLKHRPLSSPTGEALFRRLESLVAEYSKPTAGAEQDIREIVSLCTESIRIHCGPSGEIVDWEVLNLCVTLLNDASQTRTSLFTSSPTELGSILAALTCALSYDEPRVRMNTAGAVYNIRLSVGSIASIECLTKFDKFALDLLAEIRLKFDRVETTREALLGSEKDIKLDDTTGWRNLESSLKAFHNLTIASVRCLKNAPTKKRTTECDVTCSNNDDDDDAHGAENQAFINRSLQTFWLIVRDAARHINRHIREMTLGFISDLISTCGAVIKNVEQRLQSSTTAIGRLGINFNSNDVGTYDNELICGALLRESIATCTQASSFQALHRHVWRQTDTSVSHRGLALYYDSKLHSEVASDLADALAKGMQDEWSQIRLVATKAAPALVVLFLRDGQPSDGPEVAERERQTRKDVTVDLKHIVLSKLIPRLCLNRFYSSSVGLAAREAWRDAIASRGMGKPLLYEYMSSVVDYYSLAARSPSHMVCEAACQAIAELCCKLDLTQVQPYVRDFLWPTVYNLMEDERWPVRDASCLSGAYLIGSFAAAIGSDVQIKKALECMRNNLQDCIASVRTNASLALTVSMRSKDVKTKKLVQDLVTSFVSSKLLSVAEDVIAARTTKPPVKSFLPASMLASAAATSSSSSSSPPLITTSVPLKTDKKPRASWGCCIDCVTLRASVAWEKSHGALSLLKSILEDNGLERMEKRTKDKADAEGNIRIFGDDEDGSSDGIVSGGTIWDVLPDGNLVLLPLDSSAPSVFAAADVDDDDDDAVGAPCASEDISFPLLEGPEYALSLLKSCYSALDCKKIVVASSNSISATVAAVSSELLLSQGQQQLELSINNPPKTCLQNLVSILDIDISFTANGTAAAAPPAAPAPPPTAAMSAHRALMSNVEKLQTAVYEDLPTIFAALGVDARRRVKNISGSAAPGSIRGVRCFHVLDLKQLIRIATRDALQAPDNANTARRTVTKGNRASTAAILSPASSYMPPPPIPMMGALPITDVMPPPMPLPQIAPLVPVPDVSAIGTTMHAMQGSVGSLKQDAALNFLRFLVSVWPPSELDNSSSSSSSQTDLLSADIRELVKVDADHHNHHHNDFLANNNNTNSMGGGVFPYR